MGDPCKWCSTLSLCRSILAQPDATDKGCPVNVRSAPRTVACVAQVWTALRMSPAACSQMCNGVSSRENVMGISQGGERGLA